MADCTIESKKLIPLSKVVSAAIVDDYGDIGRTEQVYSHWGARILKKLYTESLPKIVSKVLLTVNGNTHTATLPLDFDSETFVGAIVCGKKVPFQLNTNLYDTKNVTEVECEDKCPKCNQSTSICNDLAVTEEVTLVTINGSTYENTVVKKLYPNGDYYLETTTPILDIETDSVIYATKKEFIVNLDLKPCGCLETTEENLALLQTYCPGVYSCYYAPCDTNCNGVLGSYRIFEESGLIQFNHNFPYTQVYLEYNGFLPRRNGQYQVPMVAFETVVEGIKWKAIANRRGLTRWEKADQFESYKRERRNMEKILGRISLSQIIQAVARLPKFDVDYTNDWYSCFSCPSGTTTATTASGDTVTTTTTATGECCITNPTTIINRTAFILNVKVDGNPGSPVAGESIYQNNVLINCTDLVYLFLAKQVLTVKDGDFVVDPTAGTINISPTTFVEQDTLIAHYNKNV